MFRFEPILKLKWKSQLFSRLHAAAVARFINDGGSKRGFLNIT